MEIEQPSKSYSPRNMVQIVQTKKEHTTSGDICPECEIVTPTAELEQWQMCRFCAQKIL
jgi:hypothetical protein